MGWYPFLYLEPESIPPLTCEGGPLDGRRAAVGPDGTHDWYETLSDGSRVRHMYKRRVGASGRAVLGYVGRKELPPKSENDV